MRLEVGVYVPVYVGEAVLLDVGVVLAVDAVSYTHLTLPTKA